MNARAGAAAATTPWLELEVAATRTRSNDHSAGLLHRNSSTSAQ